MKTNIRKGDRVQVLDEDISGKVIAVENNRITIATTDGFEMVFQENELVKVSENDEIRVERHLVEQALQEKETRKKPRKPISKPRQRSAPAMEVDLHLHQLTDRGEKMTNFEALNLQLEIAKHQLEFAIRKRIQKVVFIHGVGEGVLKAELESLFNRYDNLKFYDADYKKYGLGATEIYIFQNA